MPSPTDLAAPRLSPDDCFAWGEEGELAIQSNRHRATAISLFAHEIGVRFQDVVCRRRYMRMLTRQEAYEYCAMDRATDEWIDNHEPPLVLSPDLKWVTPDGTVCEPPKSLEVVPDDWEADEDDPVWEFCKKNTPGAIPCWELESK